MIDAVNYVVDNGITWRALPTDFPHWTAVYRFFRRRCDQGLLQVWHDRLRRAVRVREGRALSLRRAGPPTLETASDHGYEG